MSLLGSIHKSFIDSIELKKLVSENLSNDILKSSYILFDCIKSGNKVLTCGNGGSACDAQHFTTELVNRFLIERDNLPAISLTADMAVLTAIANDYDYKDIFSKQIKALGKKGDVLLAISTSGKSANVVKAVAEARNAGMRIIALTGGVSNLIGKLLSGEDVELRIPSSNTPRIQEVHTLIIHCLCDLLDKQLFG